MKKIDEKKDNIVISESKVKSFVEKFELAPYLGQKLSLTPASSDSKLASSAIALSCSPRQNCQEGKNKSGKKFKRKDLGKRQDLVVMSYDDQETVLGKESAKAECSTPGKRKFFEVFGDKEISGEGWKTRLKGTQQPDQFGQLKSDFSGGKRPKFI